MEDNRERRLTSRAGDPKRNHTHRQAGETGRDDQRAKFARALARSEFGRHHWGEETEKRFRAAMAWKNPVYRQKPRKKK